MIVFRVDVDIDKSLMTFGQGLRGATASALRSEAYRLNTLIREYADSANFGPYAPLTAAKRKGKGYGPWFSRFSRYFVDPDFLEARVGLLGPEEAPRGKRRFEPISRLFVRSASRHASGFDIKITRSDQRKIAKWLQKQYGAPKRRGIGTSYKHYGRMWANLNFGGWHRMVPKVGTHHVKARPVVEPVWNLEQGNIAENIRRMVMEKLIHGRYADVAA